MFKILYLITQSEMGGAQKNVLDLACGLKDRYGILVAAGVDGNGEFFERLHENNICYAQLKWLRRAINPYSDLRAFFEIKKLLKKERPDILHLHSSKAGFLGSLASKTLRLGHLWRPRSGDKIKIIYTVHGSVFEAPFSLLTKKIYLWLEKFSSRFKDKIICVSENDKKLWLKYKAAPAEKLVVIHNGIDLSALNFLPRETAKAHLAPHISRLTSQIPTIGTIANFYPEKGLSYLIEAAHLLKTKNYQLKTVIIGEGSQRCLLEDLIKKYCLENDVILSGAIPNAAQYLKAFDIFILPSIKEGLPYTILEAMAAGLPIIATNVGGIPEMINPPNPPLQKGGEKGNPPFNKGGRGGILIEPKNSQILAEKIICLLENPALAEKFVQNSQIKLQEFSLEKMLQETKTIYSF